MDDLAAAGVTQMRILGASEGPDNEPWRVSPSLQPARGGKPSSQITPLADSYIPQCAGVINTDVLDGFHWLLKEMGARKMRATVVLGNTWPWSGGHVQYTVWAAELDAAAASSGSKWAPNATACAAARSSARAPNISDPAWRARGYQPGFPTTCACP